VPAIPYVKTPVTNGPWDGPAQKAALRNDLSPSDLSMSFAYRRPGTEGDTKEAYALIHHETVDGKVGPASMAGCRECLQRSLQVRPPLTPTEMEGVRAHLVAHLSDGVRAGNDKINEAVRVAAGR
jgi:hypothetical protein